MTKDKSRIVGKQFEPTKDRHLCDETGTFCQSFWNRHSKPTEFSRQEVRLTKFRQKLI